MLGAAVRALQRDSAVRERRADLDDRAAVARAHALERGDRAVDGAKVGDLGHAPELGGVDVPHSREHGRHRVVDPHVDRPELALGALGGSLDLVGIGDVGGNRQCGAALAADLLRGGLERLVVAREQRDPVAAAAELARRRAADPGGRSSEHDRAAHDGIASAWAICSASASA